MIGCFPTHTAVDLRAAVPEQAGDKLEFYALANGAVAHKDVSAKTRRNMPDPSPVMVLAPARADDCNNRTGGPDPDERTKTVDSLV